MCLSWSDVEMHTANLLGLTLIIVVMLKTSFQEGLAHV